MTTGGELILLDVFLSYIDGLLAVELLRNDKQLCFRLSLLGLRLDKGHIAAPSATISRFPLTIQLIQVALT